MTSTLIERIMRRIEMPHGPTGCWLWQGAKAGNGYGQLASGVDGRLASTHRSTYEAFIGPIPAGLHIDHLCRVRACCNPYHLEAVTPRENTLRGETVPARNAKKTHCIRGHAFDAANTAWCPDGSRLCRICRNAAVRASYRRRKAAGYRRPKVDPS